MHLAFSWIHFWNLSTKHVGINTESIFDMEIYTNSCHAKCKYSFIIRLEYINIAQHIWQSLALKSRHLFKYTCRFSRSKCSMRSWCLARHSSKTSSVSSNSWSPFCIITLLCYRESNSAPFQSHDFQCRLLSFSGVHSIYEIFKWNGWSGDITTPEEHISDLTMQYLIFEITFISDHHSNV
jgi:hypothetical protein